MKRQEWNGFVGGLWEDEIDVRNFIQKNYTPYGGAGSFLCGHFITLWGITAAILVTAGIAVIGLICFFLGAEKTGPIIFSETQKSTES